MSSFQFLALPPEIRIQTYKHYFRDSLAYLSLPRETTPTQGARELRILAGPESALFLTCRTISNESRLVFLDTAVYCFDLPSQLCRSPYFIRERHYARIRRFTGSRIECEALTDAVLGFGRSGELSALMECQIMSPWQVGYRDDDDEGFVVLLRKLAMCKVGLKVILRIQYVDCDVHELLGKIIQNSEQVSPLMRGRSRALAGREDGFANTDALAHVQATYSEMISNWKARHLPKIRLPLIHVNSKTISALSKLVTRMLEEIFGLLQLRINPEVIYVGKAKTALLPLAHEYATWWDDGYDSVHEAEEENRRKKELAKLAKSNAHK